MHIDLSEYYVLRQVTLPLLHKHVQQYYLRCEYIIPTSSVVNENVMVTDVVDPGKEYNLYCRIIHLFSSAIPPMFPEEGLSYITQSYYCWELLPWYNCVPHAWGVDIMQILDSNENATYSDFVAPLRLYAFAGGDPIDGKAKAILIETVYSNRRFHSLLLDWFHGMANVLNCRALVVETVWENGEWMDEVQTNDQDHGTVMHLYMNCVDMRNPISFVRIFQGDDVSFNIQITKQIIHSTTPNDARLFIPTITDSTEPLHVVDTTKQNHIISAVLMYSALICYAHADMEAIERFLVALCSSNFSENVMYGLVSQIQIGT
jgi:hypothetical protein